VISVIITCAGNHSRFGKNKLLADLDGKPIFIRTLLQFSKVKKIDEIIVPVREEYKNKFKKLIEAEKIKVKLIKGGEERYISAYNGVRISKGKYILIHDGARPLVPVKLIKKIIKEVKQHQAVISAVRPSTCVKKGNGFYVENCLARSESWLGQTPQAFSREIILKAYKKAIQDKNFNGLDDCELVSSLGVKVKIINGDKANIKITFPEDLIIARSLFKMRKGV